MNFKSIAEGILDRQELAGALEKAFNAGRAFERDFGWQEALESDTEFQRMANDSD